MIQTQSTVYPDRKLNFSDIALRIRIETDKRYKIKRQYKECNLPKPLA